MTHLPLLGVFDSPPPLGVFDSPPSAGCVRLTSFRWVCSTHLLHWACSTHLSPLGVFDSPLPVGCVRLTSPAGRVRLTSLRWVCSTHLPCWVCSTHLPGRRRLLRSTAGRSVRTRSLSRSGSSDPARPAGNSGQGHVISLGSVSPTEARPTPTSTPPPPPPHPTPPGGATHLVAELEAVVAVVPEQRGPEHGAGPRLLRLPRDPQVPACNTTTPQGSSRTHACADSSDSRIQCKPTPRATPCNLGVWDPCKSVLQTVSPRSGTKRVLAGLGPGACSISMPQHIQCAHETLHEGNTKEPVGV